MKKYYSEGVQVQQGEFPMKVFLLNVSPEMGCDPSRVVPGGLAGGC